MHQGKKITTHSFSETQQLGVVFAQTLRGGEVVCLYGDLGSGKTTFVQGLAKGLGITKRIISPSFIIMRMYERGANNFYHVDLYRIESEKDVEGLGLLELMQDRESIVVIEWPERIENILPSNRKSIIFRYLENDDREIIFE